MFDLSEIEFIGGMRGKPDVNRDLIHYSFVGIKRDQESEKLQFWLPLGFKNFDNSDFDLVKRFFFRMYRTFKKFLTINEKSLEDDDKDNKRDGLIEQDKGFVFTKENYEESVFYTKLNALDSILEGYDELKIAALIQKQKLSSDLDYSKINRYLHQATFLEEDIAYIDEMILPKDVVTIYSPPILQLFCFIYSEIKRELEEYNSISDVAKELSETFKEENLYVSSSLFDQNYFKDTIGMLKDLLEEIDNTTAYKDEDYWHFFDAIESFLYGENDFSSNDGIYWGISNFSAIWEEMCQNYSLNYYKKLKDRILFADIKGELQNFKNLYPNPFRLAMASAHRSRYLRPDLVYYISEFAQKTFSFEEVFKIKYYPHNFYEIELLESSLARLYKLFWDKLLENRARNNYSQVFKEKILYGRFEKVKIEIEKLLKDYEQENSQDISVKVIDYKYMSKASFDNYREEAIDFNGGNKIAEDIKKQLLYEWTIQQNIQSINNFPVRFEKIKTESEFWIPLFSINHDFEESKRFFEVNNFLFNESQIKVVGVNFDILQQMYILD